MKNSVLVLLLMFLISCTEKQEIIQYSYKDITITRLNIENTTHFYYGKFDKKEEFPNEYIKVSSFDGYIQGFLIFRESGLVEIIKTEGKFEKIGEEKYLKVTIFDHNIDYINWNDKIKDNYNNIVEILNIEKIEIKRNQEHNSNVIRTKVSEEYIPMK